MRIEYHPALATEIKEIWDYYEEKSPGLGDRFIDEFEQQVLHIASTPERWMILEHGIRRALMKRFPYVIYFRILEEDGIRITVVKHEKRHPSLGKDRR